jgi:hypothetical protein
MAGGLGDKTVPTFNIEWIRRDDDFKLSDGNALIGNCLE